MLRVIGLQDLVEGVGRLACLSARAAAATDALASDGTHTHAPCNDRERVFSAWVLIQGRSPVIFAHGAKACKKFASATSLDAMSMSK